MSEETKSKRFEEKIADMLKRSTLPQNNDNVMLNEIMRLHKQTLQSIKWKAEERAYDTGEWHLSDNDRIVISLNELSQILDEEMEGE